MPALSRADTSVLGRWWWSVDRVTLLALAALIAIGYVLALAAMPGMTMRFSSPDTQAMIRQIVFLAMGGVVMLAMSMLTLRQVKLAALGLGILFFLLTAFTLVHGVEVDGAHRWISLPGFTFQPSEFLRPGFIIVSAWLIAESRRTPGFPGRRAALGVFLLVAFVLKTQPDIGMTFLFTLVVFVQFYLDGMDMKWVWLAAVAVVVAFIAAFLFISHVHTRVMLFLHPTKDSAYQALTALSAFGNGGMFGRGPGEGQVKQYLPDARADFVFAVAGEEFGLFFCAFIILVFAAHRGARHAAPAEGARPFRAAGGGRAGRGVRPAGFREHGLVNVADPDQGHDLAVHFLWRQRGAGDFHSDGLPARADAQAASERTSMKASTQKPIVIAAGGTGGHFFPAEALAAELLSRGERVVLMTDARSGGLNSPVFAQAERHVLAGAGLSGRSLKRAIAGAIALARGIMQARKIMQDLRPAAVVAFGGYPAVPPVLAARLLAARPKLVLHEQNAVLGRANRLLARWADLLALSFAQTKAVPAGIATDVLGNPVRPAIAALHAPGLCAAGGADRACWFWAARWAQRFSAR